QPSLSVAAAADAGQQLARALASAMGEPQVRAQLMTALRNSPYQENKLVLQDFLASPQGRNVLAGIAGASGANASTVRGWLSALPPMDLYVPLEVHRREWMGTDNFVVGLNLDADDPTLTGYRADGSVLQLDARQGTPPVAVVLMHPAEPKSLRRAAREGTGPGDAAITDVCMTSAGKDATIQECNIGPIGEDPGGSTGYTGGEIHRFLNYEGDGWGGIELMVKTYTGIGGTRLDEQIMNEEFSECIPPAGSDCEDGYTYVHRNVKMGPYIKVWERDSGTPEWGSDEYWGDANFLDYKVVHKFFPGCLISSGNTQASCDAAGKRVAVQIIFWHITNWNHDEPGY
ncbi:MAG TPA: hypothetical protein VHG08_24070, partial [Longimicrobium sp.]|nr:hypothetical protein [Longimicrobium sp.]